jgi:hypothetical protein
MRLGLVEKGHYKTLEFEDLSGYKIQVNGYMYDFTNILTETRRRITELWRIQCPPDLLQKRLHFGEERFLNHYMRGGHYGAFQRNSGAYVCLGLLPEEQTYNLVIHELAHEFHYRDGYYNQAEEVVRELVAIMAEEEYGIRVFSYEPHYTSQQLLHQLMELPGFNQLSFLERWEIVGRVATIGQISFIVNRFLDDSKGGPLRNWLSRRCATEEHARQILNALASTTELYAPFNRMLVIQRLCNIEGWGTLSGQEVSGVARALTSLKALDRSYPEESLSNLMNQAFAEY